MLKVKKLHPDAKLPQKDPEDMGYDLFALEDCYLVAGRKPTPVKTGIALQFDVYGFGGIIKDRSSMAKKGIFTHAGVIDSGYTGEVIILMSYNDMSFDALNGNFMHNTYRIEKGQKIAQLIPQMTYHWGVTEVEEHKETKRGDKGFGSTDSS
jgi:dUTP pyrophosphatase